MESDTYRVVGMDAPPYSFGVPVDDEAHAMAEDAMEYGLEYGLEAQVHFMATRFCAAVAVVSNSSLGAVPPTSPTAGTAASLGEANEWLLAFALDEAAPSVCEQVLCSPSATAAEQTFAAGILGRAARPFGMSAADRLLQLCQCCTCDGAAASLASALAAIAVAASPRASALKSASSSSSSSSPPPSSSSMATSVDD